MDVVEMCSKVTFVVNQLSLGVLCLVVINMSISAAETRLAFSICSRWLGSTRIESATRQGFAFLLQLLEGAFN